MHAYTVTQARYVDVTQRADSKEKAMEDSAGERYCKALCQEALAGAGKEVTVCGIMA